jgi:hypothetical protein
MMMMSVSTKEGKLETKLEHICCVCHESINESKAVSDYEIEKEVPEVVVHTTPVHEFGGGDNRYYHGACWLEEQRELDAFERANGPNL